jgi:hypothetical protein
MKLSTLKKKILLSGIVLLSISALMAQNVSPFIETFVGTRGLTVQITRYGNFDKKQSLVRIYGFDHPWNGLIFLCNVESNIAQMQETYTTQIDGKDYMLMRITKETGNVWLKGSYQFDIKYSGNITSEMVGKNDLVNDYNNSESKTNPR